MSFRRILIIVLAFLTTLTIFRLVWLDLFTTPDQPKAVQGILDLRNWEHLSNHPASLEGEWDFFPNTLLTQRKQDITLQEHDKQIIQVPGNWKPTEDEESVHGFGTYRLRILVNSQNRDRFSVHIPKVISLSEVYVNGELVASSENNGASKQESKPKILSHTFDFIAEEDEIELIIQVANYDTPFTGGIVSSPKFGFAENIKQNLDVSLLIVLFASAIYLLHALYSFIIFLLGRRVRHDNRLLYFSLIILLVILATLLTEGLLFTWVPIDYEWSIKVTNLGLLTGGYLMLQLVKQQLPKVLLVKWYKPYVALLWVQVILTLLFIAPYNMVLTYINSFVTLIPCIIAIAVMYRSISRIDIDNIFLFLGVIASVYSFVWLIILEILHIDMMSYPFDLLIAIICFATYFFKQYFRSLSKTKQMMAELQEVDKLKDNFLVSVAHEIKNPLHGIINISQAVISREKDRMKEESIRDLKMLATVGRSTSLLLNDLLELENIKEKRITIQTREVSIHSITESVVDMLRYMADGKKVQLINRIPSNFPKVIADENRLNQILFNLLHNAVKFSHDGEVTVYASILDDRAKISVKDNGAGMDEEFLDKVFEPYTQNHTVNTLEQRGIGLGLSICKQLVELHGGNLEVSSKLDEGSIFTFTLKLSHSFNNQNSLKEVIDDVEGEQVAATQERKDRNLVSVKLNNTIQYEDIRILAVDDDPVNLKVLESLFSKKHYIVYPVSNGEEALKVLEKEKWDLVIADVMMPNMSGYELTSRIRENHSISELPILLLTAYNQEEGVEAGFLAGANDYVSKPMNAVELVSRVESLVKLRKSFGERLRMEGAWLQAQIKPHFIMNTFNSIAALSRINLDRMDALIEELSNYIRLSIDFKNSDGVAPLDRELELVRSYLYIQNERFGDKVRVVWELDDDIQVNIPPLTIQTLVENAISHGILKRLSGGEVHIRIKKQGEYVVISIADNGVGIDNETLKGILDIPANKSSGIGLVNTDRRLKQVYGKGLKLDSELGAGTTVTFKIPKI